MHRLAFLWLIPALLAAQPDPRELMRDSADAIKKFRSYELETIVNVEMHGGPINTKMEMPGTVAVRRPDRMRIESRSQAGGITIVSDGENTWYYLSTLKKYIKRAASASPEAAVGNSGLMPKNLPDISQSVESVKVTGEDTISVAGKKTPCWVIETRYKQISLPEQEMVVFDAVQIAWISKETKLSLQSSFTGGINMSGVAVPVEMTQSTRTTALRVNVDLPDALFEFKIPAGAKETEDWTLPGIAKPDVVGKPAPALMAKALDGAEIDLAKLRGKVVLLDFWATWCGPCQHELPHLEKIHRELGSQGLVVIGVDVGEDLAALNKFLASTHLSYPMIPMNDETELMSALSVNSFPTVVLIDKEGKIASYEVGARGEEALRADLKKLGIESVAGGK
jgi:thiol-disulfide isomerase/thioredoxin